MKTRTKHTREVLGFCLLFLVVSLASCSRKEPAKAAKPVAKALSVASNELSRMPVVFSNSTSVALQTNTQKHLPAAVVGTPESQQALREQQKAMRKRQQVFRKKAIEEELAKKQTELARCEADVIRVEHALRAEADVALVLGGIQDAATLLESTCVQKVSGFGEMLKEKAGFDAKLGAADRSEAGAGSAAMSETMKQSEVLSSRIGEARRKAAIEIPEVAEAYRLLAEKEKVYKKLMMEKETYRAECEKADAVRQEILAFRNRSADI